MMIVGTGDLMIFEFLQLSVYLWLKENSWSTASNYEILVSLYLWCQININIIIIITSDTSLSNRYSYYEYINVD